LRHQFWLPNQVSWKRDQHVEGNILDDRISFRSFDMFPGSLRYRAADATQEFNAALSELGNQGTATQRERLHQACDRLIQIVARVLIDTE
jgi:hypothetical protein